MGLPESPGMNAFSACVPRSTSPDSHKAPAKRGPKPTKMSAEDRKLKITAFKPGALSNFVI